jgi:hypothetical protein
LVPELVRLTLCVEEVFVICTFPKLRFVRVKLTTLFTETMTVAMWVRLPLVAMRVTG